jgi:hypothetical protein
MTKLALSSNLPVGSGHWRGREVEAHLKFAPTSGAALRINLRGGTLSRLGIYTSVLSAAPSRRGDVLLEVGPLKYLPADANSRTKYSRKTNTFPQFVDRRSMHHPIKN